MHIELRNIDKTYYPGKKIKVKALANISLEIKPGEFTAIVGPSGSGKTTLLNLLGCIDSPTCGEILFDQEQVHNLKENRLIKIRRNKIGYIFQFFNLIPTLTAFENAELPLWNIQSEKKAKRRKRLKHFFRELNIFELGNRYPAELSGGQEQRVAIARALANEPSLVLADEPTGNLDSKTTSEIIELLKKENKEFNVSFYIATHDTTILPYFNKIVYLKDGQIQRIEERDKANDKTS